MTSTSRSRASKWFRTIVQALMAGALVMIGLVSFSTVASANAANPDPTTTGTMTPNSDGTVTANLSGTWTWARRPVRGVTARDGRSTGGASPRRARPTPTSTSPTPPRSTPRDDHDRHGVADRHHRPPRVQVLPRRQYLYGEDVNSTSGLHRDHRRASTSRVVLGVERTYPSVCRRAGAALREHVRPALAPQDQRLQPHRERRQLHPEERLRPDVGQSASAPNLKLVNVPTTTTTNVNHSTITLGPNGTVTDNVRSPAPRPPDSPRAPWPSTSAAPPGANAVCASTTNAEGTADAARGDRHRLRLDRQLEHLHAARRSAPTASRPSTPRPAAPLRRLLGQPDQPRRNARQRRVRLGERGLQRHDDLAQLPTPSPCRPRAAP